MQLLANYFFIFVNGNVALDVARILLRPTTELATTDISCHALTALRESSIRKVYLVGRRGAVQAAFTAKELREVLGIKDLSIEIRQADLSKPRQMSIIASTAFLQWQTLRLSKDKTLAPLFSFNRHMKKTTTTYPAYSHKVGFWEGKGYVSRTTTQRRVREVVSILKRKKRKWGYIHIFKRTRHIAPLITMEELKNNRIKRRLHELLSRAATPATSVCNPGQRELHFVFFRKPDRFLESDDQSGRVAGLCKEKTILKEDVGSGKQIAVGTGLFEEMECGLILKSVGYKSVPVDGLPFDHHKGIVPNVGGRVLSEASGDAEVEKGLYVCGWLKRGPTGIVATNLYCAEETVSSFSEDVKRGVVRSRSGLSKHGREGLLQLLDSRNVKIVPFGGWEKIDSEEKRRGGLKNKPREKLTTWQELLEVATK